MRQRKWTYRAALMGLALALAGIMAWAGGGGKALAANATAGNDTEFLAALNDGTVNTIQLTASFSTTATVINKAVDLNSYGLTITGGVLTLSGSVDNGTLSASEVRLSGGSLGAYFGGRICQRQFVNVAGATKIVGDAGTDLSPSEDGGGYYWTTAGIPSTAFVGVVQYDASNAWGEHAYAITYLNWDNSAMAFPGYTTYYASTGASLPAPSADGYTFSGWVCLLDGKTYTGVLKSGFTSDLTMKAEWKQTSASAGGTGGQSSGMGSSSTGVSAQTTATETAAESETASVDPAAVMTSSGGMRTKVANSSVKSNISVTGTAQEVMQTMGKNGGQQQSFPWVWVISGLLLVAGLTVVFILIKKQNDEHMAEICEKLHIER